jgi:hypothetical protein
MRRSGQRTAGNNGQEHAMTHLNASTCATDIDDSIANARLVQEGCTVRHVETWHRSGHADTVVIWDKPGINEADVPF